MSTATSFRKLGLASALLSALDELGYETPTPIQEQSIPVLLDGDDLLAQAQTGTGKTAAFALPALSNLDLSIQQPQVLVIAPTRELAIQVAEAFQSYAKHLKGFHVAPIYGGQDYQVQLRALKRGAHVIVGTPGRIMDHMRRGTLVVTGIQTLVLDEADEMLKMGFIDDIEWILEQMQQAHQTALFSATMPKSIEAIAARYLKDAKRIHIKPTKNTADTIEQCYIRTNKTQKLDVLTRYLEIEDFQAALIFARTKTASMELAEKLQARGYTASALNGDMNQSAREKVINRIKKGNLDIIVATDVAARGIDVDRISHVINYDIPCDVESYIHRIGRTGRAGRTGKALLLVEPREQRLFNAIERTTKKPITAIAPPSLAEMSAKRSALLATRVVSIINNSKRLGPCREMIESIMAETDFSAQDIAAALAYLLQQANPLPENEIQVADADFNKDRDRRRRRDSRQRRSSGDDRPARSGQRKRRSNSESKPKRKFKADSSEGKPRRKFKGDSSDGKPKRKFKGDNKAKSAKRRMRKRAERT